VGVTLKYSCSVISHTLKEERRISRTEQQILDYVNKSKNLRETVWLSEAIEELRLEPKEAVRSAKALEELGLVTPKGNGR
jgi:DNA-binding MarR family transcriptional regulator